MTTYTVYLLSPETLLLIAALGVYVWGAFSPRGARPLRLGLAGVLAAAVVLAWTGGSGSRSGPAIFDNLADAGRWLALALGLLFLPWISRGPDAARGPEYVGTLLLALAGLMLAASADDLVLLFLGLELVSIPTYILLYLGRPGDGTREATAKYFFLSILASALLLYGFSFLYGAAGSMRLAEIRQHLAAVGADAGSLGRLSRIALVLITAGLGFRVTAVPFHFYAPDVYQGTSHANAALLAVLPKAAGLLALLRIVVGAMPNVAPDACRLLLLLALATMTFGNVVALWQENVRRLMAYSSIAHSGYLLLGVAAGLSGLAPWTGWNGIAAVIFYLGVYTAATLGVFAAFTFLSPAERPLEAVEELTGLARPRPLAALALACCLFSLTGIPPLAGFWGKLAVFGSALSSHTAHAAGGLGPWLLVGAVAGVLNAAVSAGYYLRIVAAMYFRAPLGRVRAEGGPGAAWALGLCAAAVVVLGLFSRPLWQVADGAARAVTTPPAETPARSAGEGPSAIDPRLRFGLLSRQAGPGTWSQE